MSDKKKNTPIYSVKKFITRLGAHYIHIAVYAVRRLPRPAFGKLTPKSHKEKRERKKLTLSTVGEIVFPAVCILGLCATVKHTLSQNYAVAVEIDGEDAGMVESGQVYGEACRIVAEKMDNYSTNGEYRRNAKLTLRPVTSEETVIDGLALASKMERSISDKYPLARPTRQVEEPEPDFASFITDKNDPDLIQAVMVKADGKVLGFVSSYDKIEAALEDMRSVCYGLDGIEPEDVFLNKKITFESYEINKMALVEQDRIIDILKGSTGSSEYYEVQKGDYLLAIAKKLNMTLDEIKACNAVYNGEKVELGDNISVGTLIELDTEEPFLTVEYNRENTYEREIDFSSINIDDDTLYIGQKEVRTEGSPGLEEVTAQVTYAVGYNEEGKMTARPIKRKIIAKEVTVQPISKVVAVGTKRPEAEWGKSAGSGEYFWPVEGGYISSRFGGERSHKGLDIAAPYGTPIYAAAAGTVTKVGSGWNGGYGNCVVIQNDDGNITYYAHQSETACEVNDHVEAGQVIGYVGSTGDSTGNHLHFEVRYQDYMLDPEDFVSQE